MDSQMKGLLSIFFIIKPLRIIISDDALSLKYGDAFLTKNTDRFYISSYKDYFYEVAIDLDTINSYTQQNNLHISDYKNTSFCIARNISYPELMISIIKNVNITPHPYPQLRKIELLTLLFMISSVCAIDSLIISSIPSFSDRVKSVFTSNPSEKWLLRDIAVLFHMSESLFKKKLSEDKTSFSEILLESRMNIAKRLLNESKSIKQASLSCGFSSTSYFIQSFKRYYGITPREYQLNTKNKINKQKNQ